MEKIKQSFKETIQSEKGKDIMTVIIVILVGLGSFGLGRLSKVDSPPGIKIEYASQEANAIQAAQYSNVLPARNASHNEAGGQKTAITTNSENSTGKNFFASNRGKKYYSIGCSAGKTIVHENRVYFATREEAEQAGYELSASCK